MGNLTDFFATGVGGGVLEQISGICDGRTVTTYRGSYTVGLVDGLVNKPPPFIDITSIV